MRLLKVSFKRYKPFKERQDIVLAPTNILIGRNGSGKSALCRLLLLLAQAVSDDPNGVLDLGAGGIEHAMGFDDLIYERSSLPFMLGMTIGDTRETLEIENVMRYVAEKKEIVVEKCTILKNGSNMLTAELNDLGELISDRRIYKVRWEQEPECLCDIDFSGVIPKKCSAFSDDRLQIIAETCRNALPLPSYLGPFRDEPKEIMRTPSTIIKTLGPRGERALELLADDKIRHKGILTKDVGEWFQAAFKGQQFEIDTTSNLPRATILDIAANVRVALSNTGAGFSQALPIVVQNFAIRHRRLSSNVLIVEQPELHLHPGAHGVVADLLMETTRPSQDVNSPICIVETHSEQFIMRVRRRIAEGRDPRDFSLLSFAHADVEEAPGQIPIKRIEFDSAGNPSDWPSGVFEEAFDDLAKLRQAARRHAE